ncbi:MAG: type II secretion system F family protein [Bacillota bacterium]
MMQSIVLFLVFITAFLAVYGIYLTLTGQKRIIEQRMQQYTARLHEGETAAGREKADRKELEWKKMFQDASKVFAAKSYTKNMEQELIRADIPLRGEEFILINVLAMAAGGALLLVVTRNPVLTWLGVLAGYLIPRMVVKRAKQKRVQKFNSQIGDALVVMANSLRAGFSFIQAMEMVAKELPPPISDEFSRTLREMNLGTPTEEALGGITHRVQSDDLDLVMTAVLIQRQVGGNLSEVLDNISHTIRERVRIKGEIKTLTSQGRISGMVIGFLPVAIGLLLSVINPAYIGKLFTSSVGLGMLFAGGISQLIGVALIKKTVDIKI